MLHITKNTFIKCCILALAAAALVSGGKAYANISCDPNVMAPAAYQQCLASPPANSTVVCPDGKTTVAAPQVCPTTTCSPNVQTAAEYQKCLQTAPPGSTIVCQDGSVVTAPSTCKSSTTTTGGGGTATASKSAHQCGDGQHGEAYTPSIDLGCSGKGNAIMDMLFGIIRFLSDGVGIVVVASLIVAGVQYSAAGGDPNAAQTAIKRIRSSVSALVLFIFAYAILNYVLPGTFLK